MSAYLNRDSSKSDLTTTMSSSSSSLNRCGKKSLAFSISNILSGENNNNVHPRPNPDQDDSKREQDRDQDPSDDEVRGFLIETKSKKAKLEQENEKNIYLGHFR